MNFMGNGAAILLLCSFFAILSFRIYIKIDDVFVLLISLFSGVLLSSILFGKVDDVLKSFNFLFPYFIGYSGCVASEDKDEYVKKSNLAVFMGFGIYLIFICYYNYDKFAGSRLFINPWTNQLMLATIAGLISSVVIGYSFYGLFISKNVALKIISVVLLVLAIILNLNTATRTPIVMLLIVYVLGTISYLIGAEKKENKIRTYGIITLICATSFFLYTLLLKDYVYESFLYERISNQGIETSRIQIMYDHFKYMFDYLWGGGQISILANNLPHNFIQEGHDLYGIVVFVALLFIFIRGALKCGHLFFKRNKSSIDNLMFCFYLSVLVQMCMEPVFRGYPQLFWVFLLVDGVYDGYYKKQDMAFVREQ